MSPSARTRTTAWLGLIAMWLIVLVPLISQLVLAERAHQPVAPLCSDTQTAGIQAHHALDSELSGCGYCDLLTTHAAMPPLSAIALAVVALVFVTIVPALISRFTPLGAFPSGRPRAPPAAR
ncbi:DUF2946 domain-containing protein [Paraburkholderia unamae]|uniref:DUF2946 family protein n=1 Tax=Paraburkholderia unamae TaxID=219649 RepID=A0ABX5KSK1_9BURK|nr:DUF2946 domain-containing protein [Paraburkholderia unamae]PVX85608.1 hypothetical protein C7402_103185 [Paraburkholderia unamae]